jgi:hypothetical protein
MRGLAQRQVKKTERLAALQNAVSIDPGSRANDTREVHAQSWVED